MRALDAELSTQFSSVSGEQIHLKLKPQEELWNLGEQALYMCLLNKEEWSKREEKEDKRESAIVNPGKLASGITEIAAPSLV